MNLFKLGLEVRVGFDIKDSNAQTLKGNKPVSDNVRDCKQHRIKQNTRQQARYRERDIVGRA